VSTERQPEALRLADVLADPDKDGFFSALHQDAAAELRRQHALIAELVEALTHIQQVACSESPELLIATEALKKAQP
jgi:hypothetical protein